MQWKFSERVHSTLTFMGRISGILVHTLRNISYKHLTCMHLEEFCLVAVSDIREKNMHSCGKIYLETIFACFTNLHISRNVIFLEMQSFSVDLISILEMFIQTFKRHTSHFFPECDKPLSSLYISLLKAYGGYKLLLLWKSIFHSCKIW